MGLIDKHTSVAFHGGHVGGCCLSHKERGRYRKPWAIFGKHACCWSEAVVGGNTATTLGCNHPALLGREISLSEVERPEAPPRYTVGRFEVPFDSSIASSSCPGHTATGTYLLAAYYTTWLGGLHGGKV